MNDLSILWWEWHIHKREILLRFSCGIIFLKAIEPNSTVTTQHDPPEPQLHTFCCNLTADTAQWSHISTRPNKKSRQTFLKVHQTTCLFLNLIQNSNRVIQPDLPAMWHLPLPALLLANMEKSNQDFFFSLPSLFVPRKRSPPLLVFLPGISEHLLTALSYPYSFYLYPKKVDWLLTIIWRITVHAMDTIRLVHEKIHWKLE